jgi:hypothetical protein
MPALWPLGGDLAGGGHAMITSWPLPAAAGPYRQVANRPITVGRDLAGPWLTDLGRSCGTDRGGEKISARMFTVLWPWCLASIDLCTSKSSGPHPDSADSRGNLPDLSNAFMMLSLLSCIDYSTANSRLIDRTMPPRGVARNYRALACTAARERRRARDQERPGALPVQRNLPVAPAGLHRSPSAPAPSHRPRRGGRGQRGRPPGA